MAKKAGEAEVRPVVSILGTPVKCFYGPEDLPDFDYKEKLNDPGEYPFTRGVYSTMYRSSLWTMRQYSGQSTSESTNERFKYLLKNGQTGLSLAFDLPTQIGLDSDMPLAEDDVGKLGVAVDSLEDFERIFDGIALDQISTSFTINATAPIILAMYILVARKQGVDPKRLRGTIQNDILKEYIARGTWIFPPEPSIKLVGDLVEYCNKEIPRFNAISVSGTHILEYGANTVQAVALAISIAEVYIREVLKRGSHIDEIAPLFSFHLPIGGRDFNFFEDIARLRGARRYWAKLMKEKYGAKDKRSLQFRFSTGGMGGGLTAEQPLNNIARASIYAMAAVFSGTRSLNLACFDEVYAIPSDLAIRTSLRVQQILANETGVADVVDPLGGSYYVEKLTDEMEAKIGEIIGKIESDGGIVKLIESGAIQRELAMQSYAIQKRISSGEKVLVGVNKFKVKEEERDLEVYKTDPETIHRQLQRLKAVKESRDQGKVESALKELESAAVRGDNLISYLFEPLKAKATIGEIIDTLKKVYGTFKEPTTV
ncbi:MAG: methylmalonyl-CoA mutase [Syntrophobacterales bacterium CG03_land_8_20_14_0_80_58_14]|nr:MAG: methylmalonyl-CoA mutase [Syntrophobacterales bacterium CG03_land_8_20_14_0_80_58_14]